MRRTAIDRGRFANAAACAASFPSFRTTGRHRDERRASSHDRASECTESLCVFSRFSTTREPRLTPSTMMTLPFKIRSASVTPKAKYGDESVYFLSLIHI